MWRAFLDGTAGAAAAILLGIVLAPVFRLIESFVLVSVYTDEFSMLTVLLSALSEPNLILVGLLGMAAAVLARAAAEFRAAG
jgi:hypothetical protein